MSLEQRKPVMLLVVLIVFMQLSMGGCSAGSVTASERSLSTRGLEVVPVAFLEQRGFLYAEYSLRNNTDQEIKLFYGWALGKKSFTGRIRYLAPSDVYTLRVTRVSDGTRLIHVSPPGDTRQPNERLGQLFHVWQQQDFPEAVAVPRYQNACKERRVLTLDEDAPVELIRGKAKGIEDWTLSIDAFPAE